jgi:hypothetical protein
MALSITLLCHYAEYHYADCRILVIVRLNVIMVNVIMLSVIMLIVVIISVVMLIGAVSCHPRVATLVQYTATIQYHNKSTLQTSSVYLPWP